MKKYIFTSIISMTSMVSMGGVLEQLDFNVSGDCLAENTFGEITPDDNFTIIFGDLTIASQKQRVEKSCQFNVGVKVPPGYQIAADTMSLDGEYSVGREPSSEIGLLAGYQMEGYGEPIMWMRRTGDGLSDPDFANNQVGSFTFEQGVEKLFYSECGQNVVFKGHVDLDVAGLGSFFNLDQSIARCDWQLRKCLHLPTRWHGVYRTADGYDVPHFIEFNGEEGTYTLESGESGYFYQVKYNDHSIEGFWKLRHHEGWFRFFLQNETIFSGTWGYGHIIGDRPKGHWAGSADVTSYLH